MSQEDISLDEKRVYAEKGDTVTAFVASSVGVARVNVSGDIVGEFALVHRGQALDVVVTDAGRLAVATPEDVLVGSGESLVETGFGPAAVVGSCDGLVAAGGGRIARLDDGWQMLGELDGVRAIDGDMVAAERGVHRLDGTYVGLTDANDVATAAGPLAATDSGLYALANGWTDVLEGEFRVVSSRTDGYAHAATGEVLYERAGAADEWVAVELPVDEAIVDVAYGEATYAVTDAGTFLVDAGDGWRSRSLGLTGVRAVAAASR